MDDRARDVRFFHRSIAIASTLALHACYAGQDSTPGTTDTDASAGSGSEGSSAGEETSGGSSVSVGTSDADESSADAGSSEGAVDESSSSGGEDPIDVPDNAFCAGVAAWDPPWVAWEEEVLQLVNVERASGGSCGGQPFSASAPLEMHPNLRCSARVHSKDMNDRGFFDHTNPDGDGPDERAQQAGYGGAWVGENIASGQMSPNEVMAAWMESPGHCSNILSSDYAYIGIGYYPGGQWGHLWTQVFGVP